MPKRRITAPPAYRGLSCPEQESIIKAACTCFEIAEEELVKNTAHLFAYIRWLCFFLIKKHTVLNEKFIGNRFFLGRGAVLHGIEVIETRKRIYRQTVTDLQNIERFAGLIHD